MEKSSITELAKIIGAKVRKINYRDPNVFAREQNLSGLQASDLSFTGAVKFKCGNLKAEIKCNGVYLLLELQADLDVGTWSVNEPDLITNPSKSKATSQASHRWAIYAPGGNLPSKAERIAQSDIFLRTLANLDLSQRESLNFYKNALVYYSRVTSAKVFLDRSRALCHFVEGIASSERAASAVILPKLFSDLNDCAQQWAISDDTRREEAIESATSETLERLVARVGPRLPSINAYLDTHSGEEEAALGNLAETVAEAQIALTTHTRHR